MTAGKLAVATYQGGGTAGDVEANLAEMLGAMESACSQGTELLVFPEGFLTGYYSPGSAPHDLRDTRDAIERICERSARLGIAVVFGFAERVGSRAFNSAIAVCADGAIGTHYRKRALFGHWEKALFTPGSGPALFDCGDFRVGLLICYDVEFPELVRETAIAGAHLIVVPTSLMAPFDQVADHLVPTRAMENQIFLAYANRSGGESDLVYVGKSSICGPTGRVLARADSAGPTMVGATIDKVEIDQVRARYSYLDDLERLTHRLPSPAALRPADRA